MPFKSEQQEKFMWAKHPDVARRWADETKDEGEETPLQKMAHKFAARKDKDGYNQKPKDQKDPKYPTPSKTA